MQTEDLHKLVDKIQRLQCEMQTVELKSANKGCPTRLYDTLSSFANQDEGGIIIFGLDETNGFAVVGVYDAQDLQKKVTEQCNQMSPQVRALFTVCEFGDKLVVSAEIPGLDVAERPYNAETLTTEEKLLQFCSVPRSRQELIDFLGFSRYYTMSKLV